MGEGEHSCAEHCGIFTIGGDLAIQGPCRDIYYQPVSDNIWTARAYQRAIGRVFPKKPTHTVIHSHEYLDHCGYAADLAPEAKIIAHDYTDQVVVGRQTRSRPNCADNQTLVHYQNSNCVSHSRTMRKL